MPAADLEQIERLKSYFSYWRLRQPPNLKANYNHAGEERDIDTAEYNTTHNIY